ncbi:hypothetical protein Sjap_013513 [Stephania japonica]|uniref:non-specific serine/threonine protein kinase n=1 Tax=Stephania japonica TaxID=461633 RepID=A0AAP0P1D5_9MAGN
MAVRGMAEISQNGIFRLTSNKSYGIGQAFYNMPFSFKNSTGKDVLSFSTTFAFAIVKDMDIPNLHGHGMAFVIAPSRGLPHALPAQYLGIFNASNIGDPSNHVLAIELDTLQTPEFADINDNHVGIDINSLASNISAPAGYFSDSSGEFRNLDLASGERMLVWVDYDGLRKQINVTLSPIEVSKPRRPLLSFDVDLSSVILDTMYVGFCSANGLLIGTHYVLGWSFQLNGEAQALDVSRLPLVPQNQKQKQGKRISKKLITGLAAIAIVFLMVVVSGITFMVRRRKKPEEVLEDWEVQFGPHRFMYKALFIATKGFSNTQLLGRGGFGRVYKGELPSSKTQVAVKRVSHESSQGMKEFIAEIATIGRLRHPNLVRLLGYSRCKGELLLVYDFMPNASLDKFIFSKAKQTLNWSQRFKIIKDIATGLAYLHEEWVQVIYHRDIKASNVLLDSEFNGKLGDFGLARLSSHGMDPNTTHLAGTLGYIAPELARTGKATKATDVFAFGAFMLEVACGRRPVETKMLPEKVILVDWASECWRNGEILTLADPKLRNDYELEEMELVLKLGLLCSHSRSDARPSMSQVTKYLGGNASLPDDLDVISLVQEHNEVQSDGVMAPGFELDNHSKPSVTITEPFFSTGR